MKIKHTIKLLGLTSLLLFNMANADPKSVDANTGLINQTVTAFMKKNNVPGMTVEIYLEGQPHSYQFGVADQVKKTPITDETIFEVGSFTKVFTCLLIAQQVGQGKMKLSDPIIEYLPHLLPANKDLNTITLQNLATHTSGLPFKAPDIITSQSGLQQYFVDWKPSSPIGSQWAYSNMGIGLLGYALEANTGRNYNQLLREEILVPLGMDPIGISVAKGLQPYVAQGYDKDGKTASPIDMVLFQAAGAMRASGHDMLMFLNAAIGLPGTPDNILQAMHLTQTPYVATADSLQGLAWEIHPLTSKTLPTLLQPPVEMNMGPISAMQLSANQQQFDGNALIDKTGATDGFRAYMAVIPNRKTGIVILMNRYVSNGEIVKLGRTILLKLNNYTT